MKYIKKEDLKENNIFVTQLSSNNFLNKYGTGFSLNLKKDNSIRYEALYKNGGFAYDNIRMATPEEKHWLEECIKLDKFISKEEAMKSFVPEYVECVMQYNKSDYFVGKIYKVNSTFQNVNKIESHNNQGMAFYQTNLHRFKPSTKEAYDAQFVVKEPEFMLPEKWCIKNSSEIFGNIKGWFKINLGRIPRDPDNVSYWHFPETSEGASTSSYINKNYKEITFEQFKQFVLKEETVVKEKVIEPLTQFKIIELIETITKVENNEGNQFFIGDIVISSNGIIQTIENFDYNKAKTNIIAFTNKQPKLGNGIGIDKIEHYIETKIIEPEFILPEKWCVKIEESSKENICNWFQKNCQNNYDGSYLNILNNGEYIHYPVNSSINSHRGFEIGKIYNNYTEISFKEFKKYILKKEIKTITLPQHETLLEKAKRLYPIGTKFKKVFANNDITIVTKNDHEYGFNGEYISVSCKSGIRFIYYNHKWGEIIE